jgi:hypothetical protein
MILRFQMRFQTLCHLYVYRYVSASYITLKRPDYRNILLNISTGAQGRRCECFNYQLISECVELFNSCCDFQQQAHARLSERLILNKGSEGHMSREYWD